MASTTQSTGELTPQTITVTIGRALINAVTIQPGATITIYDNTAASGKVVFQYVNAGTSTDSVVFQNAIRCDMGVTAVVAAFNANIYFGAA